MTNVESEEHEALQFRQRIVTQLQIENNRIATFQRAHRSIYMIVVRRLAQNIQAVFFYIAGTWRDVAGRRTRLNWILLGNDCRRCCTDGDQHQEQKQQR